MQKERLICRTDNGMRKGENAIMKKRLLALALVLAFLFGLSACGNNNGGLSINEKEKALKIGETFQLTVKGKDVSWMSADPSIATVSGGLVTGISEGETVITATAGDKKGTCKVAVQNAYFPTIQILDKASTLFLEYTYDMQAELLMGGKKVDGSIAWKSSDDKVAKIDSNGHLTPVSEGKVIITASATVEGVYVEDTQEAMVVALSYIDGPESVEMGIYAGDKTAKVSYTIYLDNKATTQKGNITIADSSIASVDASGKLTALKEGETVATISYSNDKYKLSLDVPVVVSKHVLHTFTEENECYYTGDIIREGGETIGDHWTTSKPKAITNGSVDGRNATPLYLWAYYYDPAFSFSLDLSKQQLRNYLNKGYKKIVLPVYSDSKYADKIQFECAGYLSGEFTSGSWKEIEFPLKDFIDNYNSYAVKGTPIIYIRNNMAAYPTNTDGKEVGFNVYVGDIYLR